MVQGTTIIDDWIAEGEARGRVEGRVEEARRLTAELMRGRFGALPAELEARIAAADAETCEALFRSALRAESLNELLD